MVAGAGAGATTLDAGAGTTTGSGSTMGFGATAAFGVTTGATGRDKPRRGFLTGRVSLRRRRGGALEGLPGGFAVATVGCTETRQAATLSVGRTNEGGLSLIDT